MKETLEQIRIASGLSIDDVCKELKITPDKLDKYEQGIEVPGVNIISKMATLYNVNMGRILLANLSKN